MRTQRVGRKKKREGGGGGRLIPKQMQGNLQRKLRTDPRSEEDPKKTDGPGGQLHEEGIKFQQKQTKNNPSVAFGGT